MKTYYVYTDLDPSALTEVAMETYRLWLAFALGNGEIGGKTLAYPSGRYAASISWKKEGAAHIAIIADETIAPEAKWIEEGRAQVDMKAAMLGKGNTRTSSSGSRYRAIPIRRNAVPPKFDVGDIVTSNAGERLPVRTARMWSKPRQRVNLDHFATMSDAPGSSPWVVPAMAAYSPAAILADLIRNETGGR
jgi:hypothetical protein